MLTRAGMCESLIMFEKHKMVSLYPRAEGIVTLMVREKVMKEKAVASMRTMDRIIFLIGRQLDDSKSWFSPDSIHLHLWFMHNSSEHLFHSQKHYGLDNKLYDHLSTQN